MKKIIFINQETGPLLIDMINVFSKYDFEITLCTGEIIKTYAELDSSVSVKFFKKYKKNNNLQRVISWSLFFIQVLFFLMLNLKKDTKIWVSTNPPFAPWLVLFFKNISYIHVYDVYPNALLALPSISRTSLIYKIFLWLNKKSFKKSSKVFTPSQGMKNMLLESTDDKKVVVIPWWADTDFIKPIPKEQNRFISDNHLDNYFIVMYSGNLGLTHNIEKILNTALKLKKIDDIKFVIIGEGPKKNIVDNFALKNQLKNLLVLPYQDEETLPYSLSCADISIVLDSFSSNKGSESTASIPSKTYYLMAAGSVIYAESDSSSELNTLINKYNLGFCDSSDGEDDLINFIKKCKDSKELFKTYKQNSRNASQYFTRSNAKYLYDEISKPK